MKECHAVMKMMPSAFPYASVVLVVDNRNLATEATSEDVRISRWQQEIRDSGCAVRFWIPGSWNTIADYGSRSVVADSGAVLSEEEDFERYVYTLASVVLDAGGGGVVSTASSGSEGSVGGAPMDTVVHGHLPIAPLLAKIVTAQEQASVRERAGWSGRAWDASLEKGDFVTGEWVLLHTTAPNRLMPHFTGPYRVVSVTPDGNFVMGRHFLAKPDSVSGPFHVSRLLHFDMSRASPLEIASFNWRRGVPSWSVC